MLNLTPLKDDWLFDFGAYSLTLQVHDFSIVESGFNSSGLNRKKLEITCSEREPHHFNQDPIKQFPRGNRVTFNCNNHSYRFYVSKAVCEGIYPHRTLTLIFSDIFEISEVNEPPFSLEDIGVCTGSLISRSTLVNKLLANAGISSDVTLRGSLQVTLQKLSSESSISLAGKIAYQTGNVLDYQSDGVVRSINYLGGAHRGTFLCERDLISWESNQNTDPPAKQYHVTGTLIKPDFNYKRPYKTVQEVKENPNSARLLSRTTKKVRYGGNVVYEGARNAPYTRLILCKEITTTEEMQGRQLGLNNSRALEAYRVSTKRLMRNSLRQIVYEREEVQELGEKMSPNESVSRIFGENLKTPPQGLYLAEVRETFYDLDANGNIKRERAWVDRARGLQFPNVYPFDTNTVLVSYEDKIYTKKLEDRFDVVSVEIQTVLKARYKMETYSGDQVTLKTVNEILADNYKMVKKPISGVYSNEVRIPVFKGRLTIKKIYLGQETTVTPTEGNSGEESPPATQYCDTDIINSCGIVEPPVKEEDVSALVKVESDYGITQNEVYEHLSLPATKADVRRYAKILTLRSLETFNGKTLILPFIKNTYVAICDIINVIERFKDGFYVYKCRVLNSSINWAVNEEILRLTVGVISVSKTESLSENASYDETQPISENNDRFTVVNPVTITQSAKKLTFVSRALTKGFQTTEANLKKGQERVNIKAHFTSEGGVTVAFYSTSHILYIYNLTTVYSFGVFFNPVSGTGATEFVFTVAHLPHNSLSLFTTLGVLSLESSTTPLKVSGFLSTVIKPYTEFYNISSLSQVSIQKINTVAKMIFLPSINRLNLVSYNESNQNIEEIFGLYDGT